MRIRIIASHLPRLEKRLASIEKRCKKYNCEFHFSKGEKYWGTYTDSHTGMKFPIEYLDVDVEGTPKINGWKVLAALEFRGQGTVVRQVDFSRQISEIYYQREPICEHCQTNRPRVHTYIVYNEITDEYKQVGKQCLNDFTGGKSAEALAMYESFVKELEDSQWLEEGYDFGKTAVETVPYLCACVMSYKMSGYIKANAESGIPTSQDALQILKSCPANLYEYTREVQNMLDWLSKQNSSNSYMNNLKVVCQGYGLNYNDLNIAASLVYAYAKGLAKEKQQAEVRKIEYYGNIGGRFELDSSDFTRVSSYYNSYGTVIHIYGFSDNSNHYFVWKTAKNIDIDSSTTYHIKGIIKDHAEYKGCRQTLVKNCKITTK